MRTGSPMSRTKVSPASAMLAASMTRPTASSTVMKKRVTSGWVTVTASPFSICSDSTVRNEPRLPRTLPKRTEANRVEPPARDWTIISAIRLVAPRMETGSAALSVQIRFIVGEQVQGSGAEAFDLPAQLAADRASCTCYQDTLAGNDRLRRDPDDSQLLAPKQARDAKMSQLADQGVTLQRGHE